MHVHKNPENRKEINTNILLYLLGDLCAHHNQRCEPSLWTELRYKQKFEKMNSSRIILVVSSRLKI